MKTHRLKLQAERKAVFPAIENRRCGKRYKRAPVRNSLINAACNYFLAKNGQDWRTA